VATHRSQDVAGQRDELTRASGLGKLDVRLLLVAPYLLFAVHLPTPLAVLAVCVASVGYSASLLLQDRLIALTPDDLRGHALGLHTSGMLAMQAVGATIAGLVAGHVSPASAMTIMALASVVTTVALTPRLLRRKHSHAR
jgi:predicted MFS family arabinose efflux permease